MFRIIQHSDYVEVTNATIRKFSGFLGDYWEARDSNGVWMFSCADLGHAKEKLAGFSITILEA
jgi:hypothetical protein